MESEIKMEMLSQSKLNIATFRVSFFVNFCVFMGFLIKILVDNEIMQPIYFANKPSNPHQQTTIFCFIASGLYLINDFIGCSEKMFRFNQRYNSVISGVFTPLILCGLVNIIDMRSISVLMCIYLNLQYEFLEYSVNLASKDKKRRVCLAMLIFWPNLFVAASTNKDQNIHGGSTVAAQVFAMALVLTNDMRHVKKQFDGKLCAEDFSTMIELMVRFVVLVCGFAENI